MSNSSCVVDLSGVINPEATGAAITLAVMLIMLGIFWMTRLPGQKKKKKKEPGLSDVVAGMEAEIYHLRNEIQSSKSKRRWQR